jgi:hypothetical protein
MYVNYKKRNYNSRAMVAHTCNPSAKKKGNKIKVRLFPIHWRKWI